MAAVAGHCQVCGETGKIQVCIIISAPQNPNKYNRDTEKARGGMKEENPT